MFLVTIRISVILCFSSRYAYQLFYVSRHNTRISYFMFLVTIQVAVILVALKNVVCSVYEMQNVLSFNFPSHLFLEIFSLQRCTLNNYLLWLCYDAAFLPTVFPYLILTAQQSRDCVLDFWSLRCSSPHMAYLNGNRSFHSQVISQPLIVGRFAANFQIPSVISQPQIHTLFTVKPLVIPYIYICF